MGQSLTESCLTEVPTLKWRGSDEKEGVEKSLDLVLESSNGVDASLQAVNLFYCHLVNKEANLANSQAE